MEFKRMKFRQVKNASTGESRLIPVDVDLFHFYRDQCIIDTLKGLVVWFSRVISCRFCRYGQPNVGLIAQVLHCFPEQCIIQKLEKVLFGGGLCVLTLNRIEINVRFDPGTLCETHHTMYPTEDQTLRS